MKQISDLFSSRIPLKKKKVVVEKQSGLFKPDFSLVQQERCPKCTQKLYWNYQRTILICHKKSCKYILTKKSFDEIASGERLKEWKAQDRLNRR